MTASCSLPLSLQDIAIIGFSAATSCAIHGKSPAVTVSAVKASKIPRCANFKKKPARCRHSFSASAHMVYGALFFAQIAELRQLSEETEIGEVRLFEHIPPNLTYPEIQSELYRHVQGWRNLNTNADELWDVYDENRNLTGRLQRRGDALESGDFHLVVYVMVRNSERKFLLTKRSPNKGFPNMWETTGGSALAGDDSLTAAMREVKEETGLTLNPERGQCILQCKGENFFGDYWLFHHDFDLNEVVLQEGETCDKMLADEQMIRAMHAEGTFVPCRHLEELFAAIHEIDKQR